MRRPGRWLFFIVLLGATAFFFAPDGDFASQCLLRKGRLETAVIKERGPGEENLEKTFLTLRSTSGLEVDLGLLSPSKGGRRPAVILLPGNAAGAHAVDEALGVEDLVTVSLGYRYTPKQDAGVIDYLRDLPTVRRVLFDVVPAALLVRDYLRSRDDVDPTKIALVGMSFGSLFVPAIVAQDRGFAAAVMVDGGGDLRSLLQHNTERAGASFVAPLAGLLGARLLRPLEPLRHAPGIAPVPLIMINATDDALVPEQNARELFAVAREPKTLVWVKEGHLHLGDRNLLRRMVTEVRKELHRVGVLDSA